MIPTDQPIRACADCEQEKGILDRSDATKSHGDCRRHFIQRIKQAGKWNDENAAYIASMPDEAFCPDLSQTGPSPGQGAA